MKHFGLVVADNGSNWFFQGTMDSGWNSGAYPAMIAQLKTIPASAFEAIDESALMVDPNSAQASIRVVRSSTPAPKPSRAPVNPSSPAPLPTGR